MASEGGSVDALYRLIKQFARCSAGVSGPQRGRFSRTPVDPGQLVLRPPANVNLPAVIEAVVEDWASSGIATAATRERFAEILHQFGRFAAAREVTTLTGVEASLVTDFVAAQRRNKAGVIGDPGDSDTHSLRGGSGDVSHRTAARPHARRPVHGDHRPASEESEAVSRVWFTPHYVSGGAGGGAERLSSSISAAFR
jgi:hypothetical protein